MTTAVPPIEIRRLGTQNPYSDRLIAPMGSAEKRSALCGSRVIVDLDLDQGRRVVAVGMRVNACAFGQAAATIVARNLIGRTPEELTLARDDLVKWMAGDGDAPLWPDIHHLHPERLTALRRNSVQLAFQAAAEAAALAATRASADA